MMKIGVICEGQTDFIAIKEFMGAFLCRNGISSTFQSIQPTPGKTDAGGWTRVFFWLEQNPPAVRIKRYFEGSIFENDMDTSACDALIIHMDSDVLSDDTFINFMIKKGKTISSPNNPQDKGNEVRRILYLFSDSTNLTQADQKRHIFLPAVDASENWCVAAFERIPFDPETLSGQALWDAFGSVLLRSEGITNLPIQFGEPSKDLPRRERFCSAHRNSRFLEMQSKQFQIAAEEVLQLASK